VFFVANFNLDVRALVVRIRTLSVFAFFTFGVLCFPWLFSGGLVGFLL
jgi:hypothetical protein